MSKLHVSRHNSLEWSVSGHLGGKQTLTPVVTAEGGGLACYKTALFTTNYVLWLAPVSGTFAGWGGPVSDHRGPTDQRGWLGRCGMRLELDVSRY